MTHNMKLNDTPFETIKNGTKTIELRLYDEKRRKVIIGDTICFKGKAGTITAIVKALHIFRNFEELYAALPLDKCGYTADEIATASPDDMLEYYSKEQIEKYGVVGIEIEVSRNNMWKYKEDNTKPILTVQGHLESEHKSKCDNLPTTAVLFYMHSGVEYTKIKYGGRLIAKRFPRFLNACPIYRIKNSDICFLDSGRGAPQAIDTLETLAALGVKNIITVGMFGAFSEEVESGDIVIPCKAFVEEGTSLHYYESIDFAEPNAELLKKATESVEGAKILPIVSTDAVYRQTFFKEALWREKGAVGVDMETSALYSVGKLLGINVVSILIASDKHPLKEGENAWKWTMTNKTRYAFFDKCIKFAKALGNKND